MNKHNEKTILVTGATGQQGGAVTRSLLNDGWKVRLLVRDPNKESAQEFAKQGAELVKGDLYDRASVDAALKGVYSVFSLQNYWLKDVGYDGEIKQAKLLADASKAAGVQHFVYSSVGAAHRGMGQKHFEVKWLGEQYLQTLGVPYTIVRPVWFMDNLNWSRPAISNGTMASHGIRPEKTLQGIAVEDIGVFVSLVFADPGKFKGQTIELAGDELTEPKMAEVFSKVIGRPVTVGAPGPSWAPEEETKAIHNFFNGEAYTADIAAIRKIHPKLLNFEQYLRKNGWENLPVLPIPQQGAW